MQLAREKGAMCALLIEEPVHIGLSDAMNPGQQSCYGFIFLVAVENPISLRFDSAPEIHTLTQRSPSPFAVEWGTTCQKAPTAGR
jgi:hypothetical protein